MPPITSPSSSSSAAAATYTTIPISGPDVISRSFQNFSIFLSRRRPWPEFLSIAGTLDHPNSFSSAVLRIRRSSKYFAVNYGILVFGCAAVALIGVPIALIVFASLFVLWLVLFFFREDPMVAWGHPISDHVVIAGLVSISVLALWFTGSVNNLLIGIGVGILISAVHGVIRNPESLPLNEDDAVYNGLIRSRPLSSPASYTGDSSI